MPKTPIDYSKTLIYKLVKNDDFNNANIYIGSTTDFTRRKTAHKTTCNNEKSKSYNLKKYQYIRGNGGWDNWIMVEIEKHPCNDGNEARAREEYWRSHFNAQLNSVRAFITDEQKKEEMKEYNEQHKDKILEQKKEYYETHKSKIIEQVKERYEANKEKILEYHKTKVACECGCIVRKGGLAEHRQSQKHLLLTKQIKYEFVEDSD
jgi:hypothetical protein